MQIPRQQFALRISSSECQGKSFTGFSCLISGKVSKRGQASISRNLGWKGKSCLERVCNHFLGSSDLRSSSLPWETLVGAWEDTGSQRRTAMAKEDRGQSKIKETVMTETVRSESWLETCWKAVAEEEMSGNAGGLQFEKQQDKHQGWARIHFALEEECSRGLTQPMTWYFSLTCCKISSVLN